LEEPAVRGNSFAVERLCFEICLLQFESSLCQGPIFDGILSATVRAAIDRRGCVEFVWVRE
jgi:hypothetical protein